MLVANFTRFIFPDKKVKTKNGNVLILFSILAIICKKKNNVSYFYAGVLIFLLTSSELIPFLKLLPLSSS